MAERIPEHGVRLAERVSATVGKVRVYGSSGKKYTAFGGLKLHPTLLRNIPNLVEQLIAAKKNPELQVTVYWTPFGWVEYGGTEAIKGAPVLRGKTEEAIREAAETDITFAGYWNGLQKAKKVSIRFAGVGGTALVKYRGRLKLMPLKSARQAKVGKKAELYEIVSEIPSRPLRELIAS